MVKNLQNLHPNPAWSSLPLFDRTGWMRMAFGDFAQSIGDRAEPKDAQEDIYVGLEHIDPQCLHIRRWGKGSDVIGGKLRFSKGDIIFGKRRAYQRKLAVAEFGGICSAHAMVIRARPDKVLREFLPFLMMSDRFMNRAVEISVGSLSPTINWTTLKLETFDLPPLDQQRRIAEILWAMDEVEQCEVGLCSVLSEKLNALRDSICNDGATAEVVRVRDVGDPHRQVVQIGPFGGSLCSKHFTSEGVPVVKVNNITSDNTIDLTTAVRVSPDHAKSLARYQVRSGDVLIASQGDTTGRSGLAGDDAKGALISQHLARVAVNGNQCRPAFLAELFRSDHIQRQVNAVKSKTTRPGLNTDDIADFLIPLPPVQEQDEFCGIARSIVDAISACKSEIDAIHNLLTAILNTVTSP